MKKTIVSLIFLLISTSTLASFNLPFMKWQNMSPVQKSAVISILREHLSELERTFPEAVVSVQFKFIEEVYAAGFDCFIAGWPTVRNAQGRCESPVIHNSSYQHYMGCRQGQMLCNPALFGDGLCISFQTNKEKNSAFSQCEKAYVKDDRIFSEVLDAVDPKEFDELVSTVYQSCHVNKEASSRSVMCQKLKRRLQHFVPDETPQAYDESIAALRRADADTVLKAAEALEAEMQKDYGELKRLCDAPIAPEKRIYCRNLALRVKKSNELLPKMFSALEVKFSSVDCVNCSHHAGNEAFNKTALPEFRVPEKQTCSEADKKKNLQKCDEEVFCSIGSTIFSSAIVLAEALGKKPGSCMSSQNDCVTNLISAMMDSLLGLVTSLWDVLGQVVEWTGEKLSDFWDYVSGVEDKTSDAQLLLNKMSDAEKEEVKNNPIEWVTNLAKNIWSGLKTWMKEDIFCEKWQGVPRASACLQPATSFECLSCRTAIAGTCSAGGVVLAEVLPAFFTGGSVNLVARGASGAKVFAGVIKSSKAYKKVVKAVDKLSEVRAIQLTSKGAKTTGFILNTAARPLQNVAKASFQKISSAHRALVKSKGYQVVSKTIDITAKYSGFKYINKVMDDAFEHGYKFVDDVAGGPNRAQRTISKLQQSKLIAQERRKNVEPLQVQVNEAYNKGAELQKLQVEMRRLKLNEALPQEEKVQLAKALTDKMNALSNEIADINKKFIHDIHDLYKKDGIHSKIVENNGKFGLELDFTQPPTTNSAFEFYKRSRARFGIDKVTVNLEESASFGALGFFDSRLKRMEVGPGQGVQLLEDYVNSVGKHELRHSMFLAKRNRGDDSIFHLEFYASAGGRNLLNENRMYDTYMSAEELYTFSTDLQSYAQVFRGESVTNLAQRKTVLNQIYGHNESLTIVAKANKELAEHMLETVDDLLNKKNMHKYGLSSDQSGRLFVDFSDKLERSARMSFVSAEEKLLLQQPAGVLSEFHAKQGIFIENTLKSQGVDINALNVRASQGALTSEEKAIIMNIVAKYNETPEAMALNKRLDDLMVPALNKAKSEFLALKELSQIQLDQAAVTKKLITDYAKGGQDDELKSLREQLFKVGKTVKEDYKGFASR